MSYPARVGIQEAPPHSIGAELLHPATAVQKHRQHALAQINNLLVLLGVRRVGRVICHGVFLRNGRDDEGRMKSNERFT